MRRDNIKAKDIFWNTLGTVTYSAISLFISIIVINLQGKIEGGIFSFGYSTLAHLTFIVAFFGIRPLHIIDVKYRYSYNDYVKFSKISSIIALLLGSLYVTFLFATGVYSEAKTFLLLVLVAHGMLDGFSDCFESEYQRVNKLYMSGQSLFFRIASFAITLIILLLITKNLLFAEITALVVEIIMFFVLNIIRGKKVFKTAVDNTSKNKNLFIEAFPLFLIVFLDMYIFSATKFSIDIYVGDAQSGFYNLIFMPTNVVYLIMSLFMKPVLTPLSNAYFDDKKEYRSLLLKTFFFALILCIVVMLGTFIFANLYIEIINYFTSGIYTEYSQMARKLLLITMVGGCFYTINTPLFYSLIIEKKQIFLSIAYIVVAITSAFVANLFVKNLGLIGAALGFLANMILLCLGVLVAKVLNK